MKIRPMGAELFHAEGHTDDEGSSYSSRVCERVWKLSGLLVVVLTCFVMCGCFGNMCTCIYYVLYSLYCFVYVYLFLSVLSVLV
jgi:hypothetical protein